MAQESSASLYSRCDGCMAWFLCVCGHGGFICKVSRSSVKPEGLPLEPWETEGNDCQRTGKQQPHVSMWGNGGSKLKKIIAKKKTKTN